MIIGISEIKFIAQQLLFLALDFIDLWWSVYHSQYNISVAIRVFGADEADCLCRGKSFSHLGILQSLVSQLSKQNASYEGRLLEFLGGTQDTGYSLLHKRSLKVSWCC